MQLRTALIAGASLLFVLSATPLVARESSLELLFRIADSNFDGKLSPSEVAGMRTGDKESDPKRRFRKLDVNGDGRVTLEEFKRENERSRDRL